jgi:hypothetical protein
VIAHKVPIKQRKMVPNTYKIESIIWLFCHIIIVSSENAENVVKAPKNPTISKLLNSVGKKPFSTTRA